MFGKPPDPRPAAHSIFKNPREMDENGGVCGGAGAGTKSNRTTPVQSHHARGARDISC